MSETSTPTLGGDGRASPDSGAEGATEQAKEKASEVAGQAQEKAEQAAEQAKSRVQQMLDERSTELGEQVVSTADALRSVAEQLRSQGQDAPARIVEQAAERAERVGSQLRDADADQLLSDIEDIARRQPWIVVAGGLALGFAAARFLKASSSQRYQQRQSRALASSAAETSEGYDHGRTARPTEGVGPGGGRFARPDSPTSINPSSGL